MPRKAWEQLENESANAYAAFIVFRDMPPAQRTIRNAYLWHWHNEESYVKTNGGMEWSKGEQEPKYANGTWINWHRVYEWPKRALAWDNRLASIRDAEILKLEKDRGAVMAQRRIAFKETEFDLAQQGFEKVRQILLLPVMKEEVIKEDGQTLVIRSLDKSASSLLLAAAGLFRVSSDIGRKGLDIHDDENDTTVDEFKNVMFKAKGLLESKLPAGAFPEIPAESAVNPLEIRKPPNTDGDTDGKGYTIPPMERPA